MKVADIDLWNIPKDVSPPYDTRAKELGFEFRDVFISPCIDRYALIDVTKVPDNVPQWIKVSEQ